jgi:hypothetical protein
MEGTDAGDLQPSVRVVRRPCRCAASETRGPKRAGVSDAGEGSAFISIFSRSTCALGCAARPSGVDSGVNEGGGVNRGADRACSRASPAETERSDAYYDQSERVLRKASINQSTTCAGTTSAAQSGRTQPLPACREKKRRAETAQDVRSGSSEANDTSAGPETPPARFRLQPLPWPCR